jgi:hypothetical protein
MAIGDIKPQDPSDQPQGHSPKDTTPPAQGLDQVEQEGEDEHHDQVQQESTDQGEMRMMERHHNIQRDHLVNFIIGDIEKGVITRSRIANFCGHYSLSSSFEPFKVEDALHDLDWVVAMQEELNNFKHNKVWSLVERPKLNVVGTKWVFRNK